MHHIEIEITHINLENIWLPYCDYSREYLLLLLLTERKKSHSTLDHYKCGGGRWQEKQTE